MRLTLRDGRVQIEEALGDRDADELRDHGLGQRVRLVSGAGMVGVVLFVHQLAVLDNEKAVYESEIATVAVHGRAAVCWGGRVCVWGGQSQAGTRVAERKGGYARTFRPLPYTALR